MAEKRIKKLRLKIISFLYLFFLSSLLFAQETISLKVLVINPSEQTQVVPVKVYLPREVKPEDVLSQGDLQIAYDTQQGSYYVFGEYKLKPKESLEREIEIKDIWVIDSSEILSIKEEVEKIRENLENTRQAEKFSSLYKSITDRIKEIESLQSIPAVNPTKHISDYRYCQGLMEQVKKDLVTAKSLLEEVKPESPLGRLSVKIILGIIIFITLISIVFYVAFLLKARVEKVSSLEPPAEGKFLEKNKTSPEEKS